MLCNIAILHAIGFIIKIYIYNIIIDLNNFYKLGLKKKGGGEK
jgi:hypothetical protein